MRTSSYTKGYIKRGSYLFNSNVNNDNVNINSWFVHAGIWWNLSWGAILLHKQYQQTIANCMI